MSSPTATKTAYRLTIYRQTGVVQIMDIDREPSLEDLQAGVGGLIERVPDAYYRQSNKDWFARQHPHKIDAVWCNEEGLLKAEPKANPFFIPAPWGDSLYGDVLVVEKL